MHLGYLAFAGLVVVMTAVLAVMALRIAPGIREAAGGRKLFDERFGGYGFDEARDFLQALSPEGAKAYLRMVTQWDMVFPLLYGAVLMIAIAWATPRSFLVHGSLLALVVLPAVYCDFRENALVAAMLLGGPDHLTPDIVDRASFWTLWKWRLVALSAGVLVAMLAVRSFWPGKTGEVS